jgi:hypothetical protein
MKSYYGDKVKVKLEGGSSHIIGSVLNSNIKD